MGLLSSMFSGVSGLNAAGNTISVIGDNIANTNTTGFKASRTEFVDVLSGSLTGTASGQVGQGTRLSVVNQNFNQGSLETTGVTTDLAVDGTGFFIVQDSSGVFYTRAGAFQLDNQQLLVNASGQSVLGFGIAPSGAPNGALGPIDLSTVLSSPSATTTVDVNINLDPQATAMSGTGAGFDHTDPATTSNFQTGIRIYDSLGTPRTILVYFRKDSAASNQWQWYAGVNRDQLDLSAYGAPFATMGSTPATQFMPIQSGTLTFTTGGALQTESTTAISIAYDADGDGTGFDDVDGDTSLPPTDTDDLFATPGNAAGWHFSLGAASGQTLTFNFGMSISEGSASGTDATTQFGGSKPSGTNNFVRFTNQNGYSAGSLQSVSVDDDGFVSGAFSNGRTVRLAQVALARFANNAGLTRLGNNNWAESLASGPQIPGSPNQGGFGGIKSGFLELSNTDLAEEFVRMILAQRAFQANTRTISTTNELLAQLVQLGQ